MISEQKRKPHDDSTAFITCMVFVVAILGSIMFTVQAFFYNIILGSIGIAIFTGVILSLYWYRNLSGYLTE